MNQFNYNLNLIGEKQLKFKLKKTKAKQIYSLLKKITNNKKITATKKL